MLVRLKKYLYFLLVALLLPYTFVLPQRHTIKTYTIEDGLPTNVVNDVVQDNSGKMWFATEIGVTSYDATSWKNYGEAEGLAAANYPIIKKDAQGTLWTVSHFANSPILFLYKNRWHPVKRINYAYGELTYTAFDVKIIKGKPVLLVGTEKSLYMFKDDKWTDLGKIYKQLLGKIISVILIENKFYVTNAGGIFVLDESSFDESINTIIKAPSRKILATGFDDSYGINKIWLLGRDWIGYYDLDIRKFVLVKTNFYLKAFPTFERNFIVADKINRVYFGNARETFNLELNSNKVFHLGMNNGFTSEGCSNIFVDRESNVWLPSARGVDKMTNILFTNYYRKDGLAENEVVSIEEINPGEYFFGHNFSFTILKNDKYVTYKHENRMPKNLSSGRVMDVCRDKSGNVYFAATYAGFGKYSKDGTLTWLSDNQNGTIGFTTVQFDPKGQLWVGSLTGLYKYSNGKLTKISEVENKFQLIRQIYFSSNGKQFITSSGGLYTLNNNKLVPATNEKVQSSYFSIHEYKDGKFLVGKNNGLYLLQNKSIRKFDLGSFTANRKIFFIEKDKNGNFWFGTDDGVLWWDGQTVRKFSMENGLSGRETNRFAWFNDSKGKVWIGTDRGVSCYRSQYDIKESVPVIQNVLLTDLHGAVFSLKSDLEFSHLNNTFSITGKAISFRDEKRINYRMKLSGFDDDWIYISNANTSRYTNLPHGEYRLYIQAKNSNGAWSEPFVSGLIIISRPFYMTWWFASSVALGILFSLFLFYSYASQKKYAAQLEKEVMAATYELNASEQKMKTLIENTPTLITTLDSEGKILFINKGLEQIPKDMIVGRNVLEFFPARLHPGLRESFENVFKRKQTIFYPHLFNQFAKPIFLENYISPIVSADGKVKEAVIISIDQTARMQSENERRIIEEKQNAILSALPIILYNDTNIKNSPPTWISESAHAITGFTPEEHYSGKVVWRDRLHPDDVPKVLQEFERLEENKPITLEYRWLTADGKYKWFLDFISPIQLLDNGAVEFFGIWFDINERKRAQYRLEMLNQYFLKFGTNPNENINKIVQLCGQELNASVALYNCLIEGKLVSVGMWGTPEDYNPVDSPEGHICLDVINSSSKGPTYIADLSKSKYVHTDPIIAKYGMKTYLGFPVQFGNITRGSLCVVFSEFDDPTEDDFKFLNILGAAIAVEEERRSAMQLLKESVKEKDTLLREVYHRVKNNLQVISSLLFLQATNIKDKALLAMFQESQSRVRAMALVHESLYKSSNLTEIDFNEYIENLLKHLKDSFQINDDTKIILEKERVTLNIDRAIPCGLILNELITNSFKYANSSNMDLPLTIKILVKSVDGDIILTVGDNGNGLPDSVKIDGSTKTLGLNLIRKLTSQLDGKVEYEYDKGAKFTIVFPA
ncbi:MAG: two component regulator three y domain-containing protein [Stygiobacter sp.]|nr:MAG: two component regulator three y domain-containing protein [Stygiobacter sp.]KAF0214254.1 MAG: two component regulator three y domain-containing [Ignavibacteria bacterium]